MSAVDRMAVRMPGGEIRSVPRRVGLAMIANSRAKHAPRPTTGAVQVVTAESPALAPQAAPLERVDVEVTPVRVVIESVAPDGTAETVVDADSGPLVGAGVTELPIEAPAVEQPKGNAGRASWADYAALHGVAVSDEMGRNEIRDAVVAKLESDRMSRPAFTGGRPATPEDEPVTEDMVTSADPGERTT